ncbi:TetR/AcrR family transcriptional regulator [Hyphomonas sp.]|uniref:TetR/AcrR family transcriptional regulator n=1 Tax=Hyphomonas sp. TaxID=87 RepID=UPI0025C417AA|nr:TetR/AcrR family transcriptional regulator [Hyphomonas sp.]
MPKIVDHDERRRALASAAAEAVARSGLDEVKLSDIARAAGVTTGALAHYFPDKDALLAAALEEICARLAERIDSVGTGLRLEDFADALPLDDAGRSAWRVWLAYWGRAPFSESLRAIHQQYYLEIETALSERFAAVSKTPRVVACAVIAAVDGVGTRATLEPDSWPPERQKAQLAALLGPLFASLKPKPA